MIGEKEIIYGKMRDIIQERRELSRQYFELKDQLNKLDSKGLSNPIQETVKEQSNSVHSLNNRTEFFGAASIFKKRSRYSFESIASMVVEIIKKSGIPISIKTIHHKLVNDYQIDINISNLRNNIMPKICESKHFSIEKAYRGYWQYRKGRDQVVS